MLIMDTFAVMKYRVSWLKTGIDINYEEYTLTFRNIYAITGNTKLRDFQYRLLLNKLVFNEDLCKWKKRDNDKCTFCGKYTETARHIFVDCE